MEDQEKRKLYRKALREYQRIASDFIEHKDFNYHQFKEYFKQDSIDMGSVLLIEKGSIKAYLIPYHQELLSNDDMDCSLSLHIVIYERDGESKKEFDSLSLPALKWKLMNLDKISQENNK